ncbi:MAG: hypothetical protein CMO80_22975 [Verrucomicrobiales bacterium]|nr:hypothetical protein [Verrucomicrobiales bacterium]|tara:strand:- start:5879 stop:6109 length:231 start_codon:yes stop_codon:yes gene_type:complete
MKILCAPHSSRQGLVVIALVMIIGVMGAHLMVNQSTLRLVGQELRELEDSQLERLDRMNGVRVIRAETRKTGSKKR